MLKTFVTHSMVIRIVLENGIVCAFWKRPTFPYPSFHTKEWEAEKVSHPLLFCFPTSFESISEFLFFGVGRRHYFMRRLKKIAYRFAIN